jgi:hypothetical protein
MCYRLAYCWSLIFYICWFCCCLIFKCGFWDSILSLIPLSLFYKVQFEFLELSFRLSVKEKTTTILSFKAWIFDFVGFFVNDEVLYLKYGNHCIILCNDWRMIGEMSWVGFVWVDKWHFFKYIFKYLLIVTYWKYLVHFQILNDVSFSASWTIANLFNCR